LFLVRLLSVAAPAGQLDAPNTPNHFLENKGTMRMLRRTLLTAVAALATTTAATAGDLKIHFEYDGAVFQPPAIDVTKDAQFCGKHDLTDESLIVNPKNKGIKNVVVYVYTGRGGSDIEEVDPVNNTHTLANKNCRFDPRIVTMQAGDTLKVTNPDPVGHNANLNFLRNDAANLMVPANSFKNVQVPQPEPAPIPVECNIHPWMKAYVLVLEHPYVGVSDENGDLVIKDLPEGELSFRIWVEAADGALSTVKVNGESERWSRNKFEYEVEAGVNDMGTVTLTADQLGR